MGEAGEQNSDVGVVWNEMPVEIGETQEGLYSRQQNRSDVWEFWIVH